MRALLLSLLFVCTQAFGVQAPPLPLEKCVSQAPFGFPTIKKQNATKICRSAYVLEHDNVAKIPAWVSYVLKPKNAVGCLDREDAFATDRSLKDDERSTARDYAKSGYDKGHMANSADMRFSPHAQRESFIMSNMVPQLAGFNRGIWKELEGSTRSWSVERGHEILIYSGSIYNRKQDVRIGAGVTVPSAFYKVLVDLKTNEVLVFLFDHVKNYGEIADHQSSIAEVQRRAGILLPLPKNAVLSTEIWPQENTTVRTARKEVCALN